MGEVKVWSHNVSLTFYQLTSFSFHVNRSSHSWDTTFSKFDLENLRSRLWKRWTLKVTTWVQHFIDSHPFRSMSIGHPIPEIQLFQNFTLKIQGQGHGWGQSLKSQCESNILSTHILFVPCQSVIPFLRYIFFKIWPWKSKVKVMGEVKVWSHNVSLTFYRLTSFLFHVNRSSHSWDTTFSKFDLENPRSISWVRVKLKSQHGSNILSTHIPFIPCQSAIPFLRYDFFKKSKVKVRVEVKVGSHKVGVTSYRLTSFSFHGNRPFHSRDTAVPKFDLENPRSRSNNMMLHNYRSRQFHRTWNGINPSSGFRYMGSAKSGPSAAWFDKFWANGQAHMGQMGK